MSGVVFPSVLPPPLQRGFSRSMESASSETEFEVGVARKRRTVRAAPKLVDIKWNFTQEQYFIFDDFFNDDLFSGTETFDIFIAGLWYEANIIGDPPYELTIDETEQRYEVTAKLLLGVGPSSGVPTRPNEVNLSASLTGSLFADASTQVGVSLAAVLVGQVSAAADPVLTTPMAAVLTASAVAEADAVYTMLATLDATVYSYAVVGIDPVEIRRSFSRLIISEDMPDAAILADETASRRSFIGV